jgi:hypothetical protein
MKLCKHNWVEFTVKLLRPPENPLPLAYKCTRCHEMRIVR